MPRKRWMHEPFTTERLEPTLNDFDKKQIMIFKYISRQKQETNTTFSREMYSKARKMTKLHPISYPIGITSIP